MVPADERFFLGPAPALYLSFPGFGFGPAGKSLGIKESFRSVSPRITSPLASKMFFEAPVYVRRYAGIEGPIPVFRYV